MKNYNINNLTARIFFAVIFLFSSCAEWKQVQQQKREKKAVDKIFTNPNMVDSAYSRIIKDKKFSDSTVVVKGEKTLVRDTLYSDTMYVDIPVPYEVTKYREKIYVQTDTSKYYPRAELQKMQEYILKLETKITDINEKFISETKRANDAEQALKRLQNNVLFGFIGFIVLIVAFFALKSRLNLLGVLAKLRK